MPEGKAVWSVVVTDDAWRHRCTFLRLQSGLIGTDEPQTGCSSSVGVVLLRVDHPLPTIDASKSAGDQEHVDLKVIQLGSVLQN